MIIGALIGWGLACWTTARDRKAKDFWIDYGPSVTISNKTFIKQDNGYVCGDLVWGNHNVRGNYYGMLPAIDLTKEEFLSKLEKEKPGPALGNY